MKVSDGKTHFVIIPIQVAIHELELIKLPNRAILFQGGISSLLEEWREIHDVLLAVVEPEVNTKSVNVLGMDDFDDFGFEERIVGDVNAFHDSFCLMVWVFTFLPSTKKSIHFMKHFISTCCPLQFRAFEAQYRKV